MAATRKIGRDAKTGRIIPVIGIITRAIITSPAGLLTGMEEDPGITANGTTAGTGDGTTAGDGTITGWPPITLIGGKI
jgi:hypothetical protein